MCHRLASLLLLTLLLNGSPGVTAEVSSSADQRAYLDGYARIAETLTQIEQNAATTVPREQLFQAALRGMLAQVDPYSTYLAPDEYTRLKQLAKQTQPSVGLHLALSGGKLVVLGVDPGSPADVAGLSPGSELLRIAGKSTEGWTIAEADAQIALADGEVAVTFQTDSGEPQQISLRPKQPSTTTVSTGPLLPGQTGYLRITSFGANTAREVRLAVQQLAEQGANQLIVDVRWNPGGLLQAAVDSADLFLANGDIVHVTARRGSDRVMTAGQEALQPNWPLVVLINQYSASGSEVLAAAWQDHHRAKLVGQRTFGKASVQSILPLGAGRSAIKLTTAFYHRPSGRNIHRLPGAALADEWGVAPEDANRVNLTPAQTAQLHTLWRQRPTTIDQDPQLARAVALLNQEDAS